MPTTSNILRDDLQTIAPIGADLVEYHSPFPVSAALSSRDCSTFSESTNLAISSTSPTKSSRVLQVDNNPRYPYCEKHEPSNTYSMEGSSKQQEAKRVFALGDDDSHLDRNRTGNSEKAGSKAIVSRKERMIASK